MKKLLLIAFLTVAMVFTLVACTEEKPPEETTGETTGVTSGESADETTAETPADTDPVDETDPPVEDTKAPETDPPVEDTKAPETDPPVEDTKAPETDPPVVDEGAKPWDELKDVVTHLSFDELRKNDTADGIFAPGQAAGWDLKATVEEDITSLKFWGWIGIADAEVGLFGYQIDDNDPIYDAAWTHATGQDVLDAAAGTGAQTASRMLININLSKIAGEHTVKTLYKNAAGDKEVILAEFTITRNAPAIVDEATAGLVAKNVDAENADNFSAGLAGWIGFGQSITELGFSIDDGDIVWLGADGINPTPEDAVFGIAGENAIRYNIQADLTTVPYGAHTVTFYVRLEDRNMVPFHAKDVVTNDPTAVGDSSFDFDSAETPDLSTLFTFKVGLNPELCNYTAAPYKMEGINQLTLTADGTYKMTIKNLNATNGSSVVFFRGNPNPAFGDANYYGHDGGAGQVNGDTSVGCSGIYVGIITENEAPVLRINVKGHGENGAALPQIFTVPMTGRDLTVVDDNDTVKFYEGETLLATVDVNGFNKGYATEVIVTIGETSTTLDNVSVAASAASDIGFVARSTGLYWDAVTLEKLGTGSNEPDPADDDTHNFISDVANQGADLASSDVVVNLFPAGPGTGTMSWFDVTAQNGNKVVPGESYQLNNYNEMFTQANGHYAFSATIVDNADPNRNFMFVRGVRNFDFGDEGYFGHDGNNSYAGCGGIYTMVKDGVLLITIRSYTNGALVRNTYTVNVDSNKITLADDGNTVYIIVGDKLVATVEISGTRDFGYTGKVGAVAADACADKVILTLAGQEPIEVADAIVAATCNSDLGMAVREHGNYIHFSELSLVGFSTIDIPAFETPEEPEKPALEPEYVVTPEYLAEQAAKTGELSYVQHATGELKDGFITLTSTAGGDPYVTAINMGTTDGPTAKFLSIKYRTTVDASGQVFIGSGAGWTGQGDNPTFKYIPDGEWHLAIIDLNTAVTSLDGAATYLRYDFFTGGENQSIDVAYIAFFNSAEDANTYEYGPAKDEPAIEHDYVADGLVSMYQGGEGTAWTDVIGSNDVTLTLNDANKLTADGLQVQGAQHYFPQPIIDLVNGQSFTVEILFGDFVCIGESFNTFMNSGNDKFALFRRVSSDELEFKFAGNSGGDRHKIPGAQALLPNSLITVTYTVGGECVIYVNGQAAATKPSPNAMGANDLYIGHTEPTKNFNALYRCIRFYNVALTAEQVLANAIVDGVAVTDTPVEKPENATNVALGATVNATESYNAALGAPFFDESFLTDGIWTTYDGVGQNTLGWNSLTDNPSYAEDRPVSITITLDKVYTLYELIVKPMKWSNGSKTPRDFNIQLSTTGADDSWVTVVDAKDVNTLVDGYLENAQDGVELVQPLVYKLDKATDAQYIRINITKHSTTVDANGAYNSSFGEIEAWGV